MTISSFSHTIQLLILYSKKTQKQEIVFVPQSRTKTFTDNIISILQPELLFLDINVALCFPLEKCTMQHKYTSNLYQKHLLRD